MIGFHCIIYEEAKCAKAGLEAFYNEMQTVTKDVNCISAQALHRRQYPVLLMLVESVHKRLKMYNNVRWLNQGLLLKRFAECLNEMKPFMNDQHVSYRELPEDNWVSKLIFLVIFSEHLSDINAEIQVIDMTLDATLSTLRPLKKKN